MKKQEIDQERGSHGDRYLRGALPQSRGQGEFCDDGEGRGWRDIGLSSRHALGWTTARKRKWRDELLCVETCGERSLKTGRELEFDFINSQKIKEWNSKIILPVRK